MADAHGGRRDRASMAATGHSYMRTTADLKLSDPKMPLIPSPRCIPAYPAPLPQPRVQRASSELLFSELLSPRDHLDDRLPLPLPVWSVGLLGTELNAPTIQAPPARLPTVDQSPFPRNQTQILNIMDGVTKAAGKVRPTAVSSPRMTATASAQEESQVVSWLRPLFMRPACESGPSTAFDDRDDYRALHHLSSPRRRLSINLDPIGRVGQIASKYPCSEHHQPTSSHQPSAMHRWIAAKHDLAASVDAKLATGGSMQTESWWHVVRHKLWRIINPAAAFGSIVRRTLFTHRMCTLLRTVPSLAGRSSEELSALVIASRGIKLGRYACLYHENAPAEALYILLEGALERGGGHGESSSHSQASSGMGQLHGKLIGEEVLTGARRETTVRAITESQLLQFPTSILGLTADDVSRQYIRKLLPCVPALGTLDPATIEHVLPLFKCSDYAPGDDIIREGDMPTSFHILAEGSVEVVKEAPHGWKRLAYMNSQAPEIHDCYPYFGEMGFLYHEACIATVCATKPVRTVSIPRVCFEHFIHFIGDFEERLQAVAQARSKVNATLLQQSQKAVSEAELMDMVKGATEALSIVKSQRASRRADLIGGRR